MDKIFFVSFPRSGSNWLIQMVADSLGEKHRYVHNHLMKKSHRMTFGIGMRKVLFMYRHPKDALLSYAKFMYKGKVDEFNNRLLKKAILEGGYKGVPFIPWWKRLMDFYHHPAHRDLVCILRYENVLINPEKEVKRGLRHLGVSCKVKVEKQLTHATPEERLKFYTGRWKREEAWTEKINNIAEHQLRNYMNKYGYE